MPPSHFATYRKHITNLSPKNAALLRKICEINRVLFNLAMEKLQMTYQKTGQLMSFPDLLAAVKEAEQYPWVQAWSAQQILKVARRQFRDFYNLKKRLDTEYRYHRIKFPFSVRENELLPIIIGSIELNLKGDYFILPVSREFRKKFGDRGYAKKNPALKGMEELHKVPISLPEFLIKDSIEETRKNIKETRILPRYGGFYFFVEFVYLADQQTITNQTLDYNKEFALHLVDDADTLAVLKAGKKEVMRLDKKQLLEAQQFFWEKKDTLMRIYKKQNVSGPTARLAKLSFDRDQKIKYIHHLQINQIIKYLLDNKIGTLKVVPDVSLDFIKRPEVSNRNFINLLRNACGRNGVILLEPPSLS